ncbi:hypothetical protein [Methyloradius palustris]|uniref:Uncharacterized protein n=1 Tax=Methyloradius palustris TaxID=2778876 RepID=A0A8D5G145_9PROT|nr:hypothetical protein [Methyloradius palustris]BCM24188.1 hypothetical protein ZMTM_04470 [Methyloradius palustris]
MLLKKSFVVLLSLVLYFSLLAQQTHQTYAEDFDVPTLMDIPHVEADSKVDSNEPMLFSQSLTPSKSIPRNADSLFHTQYHQPEFALILRPPKAISI